MVTLTRWILRHRLLVAACWLIIALAGLASSGSATNSLSQQFSAPRGYEGIDTNSAITHTYGTGGTTAPLVPVIILPRGETVATPGVRAQLAAAFRSLLLPLKAIVLNVASVGAAWGVMTLVWQHGHGSWQLWGIPATGSITAWIPLMVFAFLFGLSMDYEVFILARMREEYDHTGRTDAAVVGGIGHTGRLVTSAALILTLAFVALAAIPMTDTKIMATGLAAGIFLDATVVRMLLVPALVSLFGRWNWWLPALPARLLRVRPSSASAGLAETKDGSVVSAA